MTKKSIWDEFTNQYQVQKTLRFELKPIGETEKWIREKNIISAQWKNNNEKNEVKGQDKERADNYKIAKRLIDEVNRLFIQEALEGSHIQKFFDKKDIEKAYVAWKNRKDKNDKWENEQKALAKKLAIALDEKAKDWRKQYTDIFTNKTNSKNLGIKLLYSKDIFPILKEKINSKEIDLKDIFPSNSLEKEEAKEKALKLLETFDNFYTYFKGFEKNRANVYNTKDFISTSIAYRLFEQNLPFHFLNVEKWERIEKSLKTGKNKEGKNIKDVLKSKKWDFNTRLKEIEKNLAFSTNKFFKPQAVLSYFSQSDIDKYNEIINGKAAEAGKQKIQGLNEFCNLSLQQAQATRKEFPKLEMLYKQILSKGEKNFIDNFQNDQDMLESISKFYQTGNQNIYKQEKDISGKLQNYTLLAFHIKHIKEELENIRSNEDLQKKIFLKEKTIREISMDLSNHWNNIHQWIQSSWDEKELTKKQNKSIYSWDEIITSLNFKNDDGKSFFQEKIKGKKEKINLEKNATEKEKENAKKEEERFELQSKIQNKNRHFFIDYIYLKLDILLEKNEEAWKNLQKEKTLELSKIDSQRSKDEDKGSKQIFTLKEYLDSCMDLFHFIRNLQCSQKDITKADFPSGFDFYEDWEPNLKNFCIHYPILNLYNKVRNHITKKPYTLEKLKINFENSTLLDGWDIGRETANLGILFEKAGNFYLGIMDKNKKQIFANVEKEEQKRKIEQYREEIRNLEEKLKATKETTKKWKDLNEKIQENKKEIEAILKLKIQDNESCYRKVIYNYLPDIVTNVPRLSTQLKEVKAHFKVKRSNYRLDGEKYDPPIEITKEIYDLNNKMYSIGDGKEAKKFQVAYKNYLEEKGNISEFQKALFTWIEFTKKWLKSYKSSRRFQYNNLKVSNDYHSLDEFYKDIDQNGYDISFVDVPERYINEKINKGELYLFQIYNKDFSKKSKGKNNLHTMYWKMLFDPRNLKNVVAKLNGQAEIFFRPASIFYNEKKRKEGHHHATLKNKFKYPILKDKRFSENKYLFHCPLTLNFKAPSMAGNFNLKIKEFLKEQDSKVNIIGIDRGEKHLLYYSVTDQKGNILEQGSLNTISTEYKNPQDKVIKKETDFHKILTKKEEERDKARKQWGTVENIKEIKAGYLSLVVHKLAQLIIQYNAIVVLEDLNVGFKRGRFKVEKQVYQKFERALIEKLNYLTFKDRDFGEAGHSLKSWQLTNFFESFQKLGKQSGILFYTSAAYTSTTDPISGFIKNIYYNYKNVSDSQEFWKSFDTIYFDKEKKRFAFHYTLGKVKTQQSYKEKDEEKIEKKEYIVYSHKEDIDKYNSKSKKYEEINVSEKIIEKLNTYKITYENGECIKEKISKVEETSFHKDLIYFFNLTLNMRFTKPEEKAGTNENDYILSPVEPFFDSRKVNNELPENGDANGAYNIARKGICILKEIQNAKTEKDLKNVNISISKKYWQDYAQNNKTVKQQKAKYKT